MSNPPLKPGSYLYPETSANSRQAQSTPPISVASGSCITLKNRLNQKATVHDATDDECSSEGTVQTPSHHDQHKRVRLQDILSQGDDRGEDFESPLKRAKILATTWTSTDPPDVSNYINERMLELSYVTRRAFAARIRYGRLRSHELDLMRSIVEYENEQSKIQINAIDLQINSLKDTLRDAGVDMESKECRLSKDNIRMFSGDDDDDEASWQEDDSCDVTFSFGSSGSGSDYASDESHDD
ncbi:hypothetical protein BDR06DRAFT_997738 [Suillus hirtellus]|nr:hypothetical protein BDR06DRAFT_997738 [Suillus hirtellus]